jgi:hypothetical protein
MADDRDDLLRLAELAQRQLDELRGLREQAARHTELLQRILEQLASIERTQYG